MTYGTITVEPIAGALGAVIRGPDLSRPLDQQCFAEIHAAFLKHLVIFLEDQDLTPDQLLAFAKRFGPIVNYPFVKDMDGHPGITEVIKTENDTLNFGGLWHSDTTYLPKPPLGSILYARELPPRGGDTLFANMYLAYETLSDGMKAMLNPLRAVCTAALRAQGNVNARERLADQTGKGQNRDTLDMEAEHPVIRTHPETGRKALYINRAHTSHFVSMTPEESRPILQFLFEHMSRPEFTCRYRWNVDAVALWDNRCSHHYALNDYQGYRRLMHRVTIEGDTPV
jgi:alpha-ketoglutarate-dependent taurine dioxygenase